MKKLPLQRLKQVRNEPVMISLKTGSDYSHSVLKKPLFNDGLSPLLHCIKLTGGEWAKPVFRRHET
jgi:hypothetical protein